MKLKYSSVVSMLGEISLENRHYLAAGQRQYGIKLAGSDLGIFWIRRLLEDASITTDQVMLEFVKQLADQTAATDYYRLIQGKNLAEVQGVSSALSLDIVAGKEHLVEASEVIGLHLARPVADSISLLMELNLGVTKNLVSTAAINEVMHKETGKRVTDILGVQDLFGFLTRSVQSELVQLGELATFQTHKKVFDVVGATDDFKGEATVGDDQLLHTVKSFADPVRLSEIMLLTLIYGRSFNETMSVSDTFQMWVNSLLYFNKVTVQETFRAITDKILQDSVNINDLTRVSLARAVSDSALTTDTLRMVFHVVRRMSDHIGVTDAGRILQQSYAASGDYFADDYTGNAITF